MALSGLDIFKLLPKTNCGDCGVPTCMAFAMKLAQKKAELDECPHASEDARDTLGAASRPPICLVKIGVGAQALEVGNETVMFRHEKTFYHQTGIAVQLRTSDNGDELLSKIGEIENYKVERVGEELKTDLFFISHDSSIGDDFLEIIESVNKHSTKGMILDCPDEGTLEAGLELLKNDRPAVFLRGEVTDRDIERAQKYGACIILTADTLENLAGQVQKASQSGFDSIILNMNSGNVGQRIQDNTIMRRSALRRNFKPFGYPLFTLIEAEDEFDLLTKAAASVCKYDSIIVLPGYDKAMLYALFTLRQNIYTDPQKPIQVDPGIYPIGEPTPASPIFVTTNFSLTYFIVSGEIENAGISAHLVICDCEGQSVLTAWAAGKFIGETIARFIKEIDLERKVTNRKLVIPGFVSQISGDLEEKLPGWEIIVGCQEATDIPLFIKSVELM